MYGMPCPRCADSEREIEKLKTLLKDTLSLAEFWITREDRSGLSDEAYRTWHALGFGSKTYRRAKSALNRKEKV
jgi:hypothetical protein